MEGYHHQKRRAGATESRHRDRREAKKPDEITTAERIIVAQNRRIMDEGRAAVAHFIGTGQITFKARRQFATRDPEVESKIRAARADGKTLRQIASDVGIHLTQVVRIMNRGEK